MKSISQCNLKDYFSLSLTKKKNKKRGMYVCVFICICASMYLWNIQNPLKCVCPVRHHQPLLKGLEPSKFSSKCEFML